MFQGALVVNETFCSHSRAHITATRASLGSCRWHSPLCSTAKTNLRSVNVKCEAASCTFSSARLPPWFLRASLASGPSLFCSMRSRLSPQKMQSVAVAPILFIHFALCVPRLSTATKAAAAAAALNRDPPSVQGRQGCDTTGLFAGLGRVVMAAELNVPA